MAKHFHKNGHAPRFSRSTLLFAMPSWLSGAARLLDIGQLLNEYNFGLTSEQTDELAIASDWRAVGDDMRTAMYQVKQHQAQ